MSSQSLWIQIPLIIGIPLAALFIITLIKAATARRRFGNENAVDIGMDLAVLATGAAGSIFANGTLYAEWGVAAVVYGSLTTLVCIIFIGWLAVIRRWHNAAPVSATQATLNVLIGLMPLGLVTAILIVGYTLVSKGANPPCS
jgi:hypothetical protein